MATVGDLGSSIGGLMAGLCMCLATAGCQVYQTKVMQRCQATPQQLLVYTGPFAGLMLLVSMPVLEDMNALMNTEWSGGLVFAIALTCLGAAAVNLSVLMILDYSSPLTNQMVGHLKTCLVIFIGQALFGATITFFTVWACDCIKWHHLVRKVATGRESGGTGQTGQGEQDTGQGQCQGRHHGGWRLGIGFGDENQCGCH
eukprot:TRINITY_DN3893_c0_g2_i2.p1 TRINITY_DN3893_c0_g2~~TRINITY_DN3893_c0_g2_i2.p1  ORF type:complete len:200 (+),score=13.18 TRINITY_DN3893_c0_g2_i2:175-774(+)